MPQTKSQHHLLFRLVVAFVAAFALGTGQVALDESSSSNDAATNYFGGPTEYLEWLEDAGAAYDHSTFLPSPSQDDYGAAVFWTLESSTSTSFADTAETRQEDTTITGNEDRIIPPPEIYQHLTHLSLSVVVRSADDLIGWLGFGITENGGMRGADMMLFETAHPDRVRDAHVLDELTVHDDECSPDDWKLVDFHEFSTSGSSSNNNNESNENSTDAFLIVQVRRLVDTGDDQDRPIFVNPTMAAPLTRIIAAWGHHETVTYHGLDHRVRGAVRWNPIYQYDETFFATQMAAQAAGRFRVGRSTPFELLPMETWYESTCVTADDIAAQGLQVQYRRLTLIGMEPVPDAKEFVHHFTINAYTDLSCSGRIGDLVYVWAPGESPFMFPDDMGFYAGPSHFLSFMIQIHYNNPKRLQGITDDSYVNFYYTTERRPIEAGMIQLGDPYVRLRDYLVGPGVAEHAFGCPGSCANTAVADGPPVTILREYLHMHAAGAAMKNQLIRDGQVVHESRIDFFDFKQQGNQAAQQEPYQVLAGDEFATTCVYRGDGNVKFGLSSQEEMCIAFIIYYPRRRPLGNLPWVCMYQNPYAICDSSWESRELDEVPRAFGGGQCVADDPPPTNNNATTNNNNDNATIAKGPVEEPTGSPTATSAGSRFGALLSTMSRLIVALVVFGVVL